MDYIKKVLVVIFIACCISFCASKHNSQMNFPQEIAAVYFQEWIGGQEQSGRGTNFYIELKNPILKEVVLEKIYFQNQEAGLITEDNRTFVARFYQMETKHDLILDSDPLKEYGNTAPVIVKPKFDLKRNEAILQYKKKNKTAYYKMVSVKEKPIIIYPSRNKPKK